MTLRFSARARTHLDAIQEYVRARNPRAAERVGARIREATELLLIFPYAGRPGRSANTRELVVSGLPYIIVYEVNAADRADVMVLGVFHSAQDPDRR